MSFPCSNLLPARAGALCLCLSLLPFVANAAWTSDPSLNLPLCAAPGEQHHLSMVADGSGGAFAAWVDDRNGEPGGFYLQHVGASGTVGATWPANGLQVLERLGQGAPVLAPDGAGGVLAAYGASRLDPEGQTLWSVVVHHILADGTLDPAWPAPGLVLYEGLEACGEPAITTDGAHGAYVVWLDRRLQPVDLVSDLFAQHVLAGGTCGWATGGLPVCTAYNNQIFPVLVPDGAGGAIVAWQDSRRYTIFYYGPEAVYAQHLGAGGVGGGSWPLNGRAVSSGSALQERPRIASDGSGGAIVTWMDGGTGDHMVVRAQRILAGGALASGWGAQGRAVCDQGANQQTPEILADGGGAIIAFGDQRPGHYEFFAQRLTSAGAADPAWPAEGLPLFVSWDDQWNVALLADGAHGFYATISNMPLMIRHLLAGGVSDPAWPDPGVEASTSAGGKQEPVLVSDGAGGTIAAWLDYRDAGMNARDVYAQAVRADGRIGDPTAGVAPSGAGRLALAIAGAHPSRGGALRLDYTLAADAPASIVVCDVAGRTVFARDLPASGAGRHAVSFERVPPSPGLYFVRLVQRDAVCTVRWVALD